MVVELITVIIIYWQHGLRSWVTNLIWLLSMVMLVLPWQEN